MKKYIVSLLLLCAALAGCQNPGDYQEKIFFTGTEMAVTKRFPVDIAPISYPVSISASALVSSDVTALLVPAPELVEAYNQEHNTIYNVLPANTYRLVDAQVTIPAGKAVSSPAMLEITTTEGINGDLAYLVPIRIADGADMPVLKACAVIYVIISVPIITAAPNLNGQYFFEATQFKTCEATKDMGAFTMETRICPHRFRSDPERPTSCSIMGIEERCLLRFGDVSIARNQLQVAGGGDPLTVPTPFEVDRWYHIALTYDGSMYRIYVDGKLEASTTKTGTVNLAGVNPDGDRNEGWRIGYAAGNGRWLWADLSEMRVWSVARSQAELVNNMCYVDPQTPGLVAYWRFNEGEGGLIKDYSPNQFDIQAQRYAGSTGGTPQDIAIWQTGVKCNP